MKTLVKYISNFKFNTTTSNNDNLEIDYFENINLNNGEIQSEICKNDLLYNLVEDNNYNNIIENNSQLLTTITQFIPYEFFDEISKSIKKRIFAIDCTNKIYELNNETLLFDEIHQCSNQPNIIFDKSLLYFFDSNNKCLIIDTNSVLQIEDLPSITSYTRFNNKLFFLESSSPYAIYQGEDLELKNLSNNLNQYQKFDINLEDGEVLKILILKNKLYVFTNYCILKYDSDNDTFIKQNELNLNNFKNTIELLDECVVFYTQNGLFSFNGNNIEQISDNKFNIDKNAKSVCFCQNYYIKPTNSSEFIYKFDFNNNYFIPLKFDKIANFYTIKTHNFYLFCVCLERENLYNNYFLSITNSENYPEQSVKFKPTLFNSTKLKQLKTININSEGDFNFVIESNISANNLKINNSEKINNLCIEGNIFYFKIISQNYFKIKSILIEYTEVGE